MVYKGYYIKKRRKKLTFVLTVLVIGAICGGVYCFDKLYQPKIDEQTLPNVSANEPLEIVDKPIITKKNTFKENSKMNLISKYSCGHEITTIDFVPPSFVGKTKEEVENLNSKYIITSFSPEISDVSLTVSKTCDDHYIVKLTGNKLSVFKKNALNSPIKSITIDTSLIYEDDMNIFKNGFEVSTKTEALEYLEDFAS